MLAVDIVLSDSSKGGSPLSELPGLVVFGRGWGAGGSGDKRPPCYLCVKGHIGLAEEAKATTICVFRTLWCSYLDLAECTHTCARTSHRSLISVHAGRMMKDALSEKAGKPPHMFPFL